MICLDTNVIVAVLKEAPAHLVERFRRELPQGALALPVMALLELHYGIANRAKRKENLERLEAFLEAPVAVLPFEAGDAAEAGEIRAELKRAGTPIGPYDVLIAAQAGRRSALLVTANTRDFVRVPGLLTADWSVA